MTSAICSVCLVLCDCSLAFLHCAIACVGSVGGVEGSAVDKDCQGM